MSQLNNNDRITIFMKTSQKPENSLQRHQQPPFQGQRNSIIKIKFLPKHSHDQFIQSLLESQPPQLPKKQQNILEFQNESQEINPWSTSNPIYTRQDQKKGMNSILETTLNKIKKKKKIDVKNNTFINKAAFTTRSWNAERQRLMNLRKQMHMASPVLQADVHTSHDNRNMLCMHKGQNQQSQQSQQKPQQQQQQSQLKKLFWKHRQLLSRIYSHSCQPSMVITNNPNCHVEYIKQAHTQPQPHAHWQLPSRSTSMEKGKGIKINKIFSMESEKRSRHSSQGKQKSRNSQKPDKQEEELYNFRCTSFKRVFRDKEKEQNRKNLQSFSEDKYKRVKFEESDEQLESKDKNINQIRIFKISSVGSNVKKKKQLVIL